jgi:hypothetical protein
MLFRRAAAREKTSPETNFAEQKETRRLFSNRIIGSSSCGKDTEQIKEVNDENFAAGASADGLGGPSLYR